MRILTPLIRAQANPLTMRACRRWSFHHFYHADWRLNYHAGMFSTWRQMQYNVTHLLGHEYGLPKHEISLYSALADYNWPNEARQRDVCARYEPRWEINGKFPRQDKYSVAISFFSAERLPHLPKLIKHYLLSDLYVPACPPFRNL